MKLSTSEGFYDHVYNNKLNKGKEMSIIYLKTQILKPAAIMSL